MLSSAGEEGEGGRSKMVGGEGVKVVGGCGDGGEEREGVEMVGARGCGDGGRRVW